MHTKPIYDIIGIGIGPFNLGLAALANSIPDLNCLFVEQNKEFNWHPGMMIDNTRLQVPFYADLVTLADPCSRFSFLAFLKAKKRMFRFAILENNFITRKEYNEYCRWVADQIDNLHFGFRCEAIRYEQESKVYSVYVRNVATGLVVVHYSRYLVIGVGSVPFVPECASSHLTGSFASAPRNERGKHDDKRPLVFHSSDYLYFKEPVLSKKSVAIVGSGQSAAEIFSDLLNHSLKFSKGLNWFTKSDHFCPMDYSKFALEKTSPEYIDHFFHLPVHKKGQLLRKQDSFYKGINSSLINEIYTELYLQSLNCDITHIRLYPNSDLQGLSTNEGRKLKMSFHHWELDKDFDHCSEALILATGYRSEIPAFTEQIQDYIQRTDQGKYQVNQNYSIDSSNSIFVQNAELHSHGFNAPDLGMGPYRNGIILNSILQREHFTFDRNTCVQTFKPG